MVKKILVFWNCNLRQRPGFDFGKLAGYGFCFYTPEVSLFNYAVQVSFQIQIITAKQYHFKARVVTARVGGILY
jgi:hypothetical protein